jgi:PST family polysaccharide transporter
VQNRADLTSADRQGREVTGGRRSLAHSTLAGFLWMFYGKGAYAILQIVVLAILARLVTPAEFGVVSAALIVITLSSIMSQLGLGPALVQRPTLERRHIDTAFHTSVLLSVLLGALVWLGAPLASGFFHVEGVQPVLRALAWLFPLHGLGSVAESLLKRQLRFRWLANLDVISYGVGYGAVGITLAALGWGVWALVAGQLAQGTVKTAILLSGERPSLRTLPDRQAFRELMYFGGGFTVAKIANQIAQQGDYLVVGRFLGPAQLGYYGRAYNLMSAPASGFAIILDYVLFPAMARIQTNVQRLAAAYRRGMTLIALVVLPGSIALIILAPEVIHVVLGPRWTSVIMPFQILLVGMLFRTGSKMADSLTRATGAVFRRAWRQILYAGLVVGGALVGKQWGISGVACGVLLALTVNYFLMAHLSLSETQMTWTMFWAAHLPAFLISLVSFPLVWLVANAFRHWGTPPLATLGGSGAVLLGCGIVLVLAAPGTFLGSDGQWMVQTLRSFVQKVVRPRLARVATLVAK